MSAYFKSEQDTDASLPRLSYVSLLPCRVRHLQSSTQLVWMCTNCVVE